MHTRVYLSIFIARSLGVVGADGRRSPKETCFRASSVLLSCRRTTQDCPPSSDRSQSVAMHFARLYYHPTEVQKEFNMQARSFYPLHYQAMACRTKLLVWNITHTSTSLYCFVQLSPMLATVYNFSSLCLRPVLGQPSSFLVLWSLVRCTIYRCLATGIC